MSKTPRIDVLTVTLKRHIPIDRKNAASVLEAYSRADELTAAARDYGQAGIATCLNRVTALALEMEVPKPQPEAPDPADDNLDIPERLRRTAETKTAAAE